MLNRAHHRQIEVDGRTVFYREAGAPDQPVVLLLHGAPASSYMFRELIPLLADRYHVIAPDYLGFGLSAAPAADEFEYTFDHLTDSIEGLLAALGVRTFAMYVQDYGAPVGWRLLLRDPERVTAIISQNGNAYEDGFVDSFWAPLWRYAENRNPADEATLRGSLTTDSIRWQYTHGLPDPSSVAPDSWMHDVAQVNRPGNPDVQLALYADYPTNRDLYPDVHAIFRSHQPPVLAIWGKNDEIFGPDGARAFAHDLPEAEIVLLDGGHFLLESHLDEVAGHVRAFLARVLEPAADPRPAPSPQGRFLILGGTGKVGARLTAALRRDGREAVAASRTGDVRFDWRDRSTWPAAVAGASGVFIVGPGSASDWSGDLGAFLEEAAAAGIRHAVLLSARGVEFYPGGAVDRAERALMNGPVPWTVLRPSHFSQNFTEAMFVPVDGVVRAPVGEGAEPFIDVRDIAEVAARVLVDDSFVGSVLELSGPAPVTFAEATRVLSNAAGTPIRYEAEDRDLHIAGLRAAGTPEEYIRWRMAMLDGIRSGADAYVSDGVPTVLGRPATSFEAWSRG